MENEEFMEKYTVRNPSVRNNGLDEYKIFEDYGIDDMKVAEIILQDRSNSDEWESEDLGIYLYKGEMKEYLNYIVSWTENELIVGNVMFFEHEDFKEYTNAFHVQKINLNNKSNLESWIVKIASRYDYDFDNINKALSCLKMLFDKYMELDK
ncbi:MAG: hypothetical protein LBM96_03085 [Methanobrevibacter sp.]|jgi:hypothetical protein|nr:hypothetical protein [Candidatus Methanoflexus mossambicus]